ncbi:MAG TPA: serine hydrolase domain-containing protein [Myxococcaceae bacterium]|jgi:CubicO group peptidase (beta-lactamase class C family)
MFPGAVRLFFAALVLSGPLALAQPSAARAGATRAQVSATSLARLDAYLQGIYPADAPGGVVLVTRDGKTIFRKAYGLAHLERGSRLTPDAVFRIASITKTMTAAAILQFVEKGQLSLEDEVTKHFPDYPTRGQRITLRHLLSHTSGLPDYADLDLRGARNRPPQQLLALTQDLPLGFMPGTDYAYSNTGYVLLGLLIEKLSGLSYGEYMERQLFKPLGMRHTVYASRGLPGLVPGYRKKEGQYENVGELDATLPYAAGALLSTVDDLARWNAALDAGKVLSERSLREAFTRTPLRGGRTASYGLGWGLLDEGPYAIQHHAGDFEGYTGIVYRVPARRLAVIVLSNNIDSERHFFLAPKVAQLVLDEDWAPGAVALSPEALAAYTGAYRGLDEAVYRVTREAGKLVLQVADGPKVALQAFSATEFAYNPPRAPPARVRFSGEGAAASLRFVPNVGADQLASRVSEGR